MALVLYVCCVFFTANLEFRQTNLDLQLTHNMFIAIYDTFVMGPIK